MLPHCGVNIKSFPTRHSCTYPTRDQCCSSMRQWPVWKRTPRKLPSRLRAGMDAAVTHFGTRCQGAPGIWCQIHTPPPCLSRAPSCLYLFHDRY